MNDHIHDSSGEVHVASVFLDFYRRGFRSFDDGPGAIFRERALRSYTYSNDTIAKCGDAYFCVPRGDFDSVAKFLDMLYGTHMLPTVPERWPRAGQRGEPCERSEAHQLYGESLTQKRPPCIVFPRRWYFVIVAETVAYAANHCSKKAEALAPSIRRRVASMTRHRAVV